VAVLGRILISSAERLDLPDILSIDSYSAGDWKYFLKGLVGDTKPYILKGFDVINPDSAIGTQNCSIRVADSVVFYPGSSAGAFFHGLQEGHPQAAPLVPELRKNAINYVYLTLSTVNTSADTRAFWDPEKDTGAGGEFTQDINTESVLKVDVNVSTGSFPANTIPVAKITVGALVITAIQDARDLMFRLGTGGISPNPYNSFSFRSLPSAPYQRTESPTTMVSAGDPNPFQSADKNIFTLKEWMDVVMTKLNELGGTNFWYENIATLSLINNFIDSLATTFKSKGQWLHDASTAGLVTWTEDVLVKVTQDPRTYIIRSGNKTLADEQVAYLSLVRASKLNSSDQDVSWTNGQNYVNTVGGAVGLFANLAKGDWVKKVNDTNNLYLRVEEFYDSVNLGGSTTTAANAKSVRLSGTYQGTTSNDRGRYDKGVYASSDVLTADRNSLALQTAGGNFHWMVVRSDTIENVSAITPHTVSGTIVTADGVRAQVSSTAHGLVDGDRLTLTAPGAQAGTYVVEVEDANTFYIATTNTTTGSLTGFYAVVTTAARSTAYGLQLESANHGFESGEKIIVAGTTNFNGSYLINKRSATTFNIALGSAPTAETSGTATLARVNVRSEQGIVKIIQGEIVDIGDGATNNIKTFIGMSSLAQTSPVYATPLSYNALDGFASYNGLTTDSLTDRASKLTAMMADKAQDKTIKYILAGANYITNTTNGSAQEITFSPSGSTLTIATPGSTGSATVTLPNTAPGISLATNQVAYVTLNRNSTSTPSISVVNLSALTINENTFVIAARLAGTTVYMWDCLAVPVGTIASLEFLQTVVRQNLNAKLVEGGTWSWTTPNLTWSAGASIRILGLSTSVNSIAAGTANLANTGDVAYVDLNRVSPGGALTVVVAAEASLAPTTDRLIIARRESSEVVVGSTMRLMSGQSQKLHQGTSDQTLTYIGSASTAASAPSYTAAPSGSLGQANYNTVGGESLTTRLGKLTSMFADANQDLNLAFDPGTITWDGTNITITSAKLSVPGTTVGASPVTINNLTSTALAANSCLYVDIIRSTGTALTLASSTIVALTPVQQRLVLVRNIGGDLLVR
jgi:hypothetical protein